MLGTLKIILKSVARADQLLWADNLCGRIELMELDAVGVKAMRWGAGCEPFFQFGRLAWVEMFCSCGQAELATTFYPYECPSDDEIREMAIKLRADWNEILYRGRQLPKA
jgi:hypothetical protein